MEGGVFSNGEIQFFQNNNGEMEVHDLGDTVMEELNVATPGKLAHVQAYHQNMETAGCDDAHGTELRTVQVDSQNAQAFTSQNSDNPKEGLNMPSAVSGTFSHSLGCDLQYSIDASHMVDQQPTNQHFPFACSNIVPVIQPAHTIGIEVESTSHNHMGIPSNWPGLAETGNNSGIVVNQGLATDVTATPGFYPSLTAYNQVPPPQEAVSNRKEYGIGPLVPSIEGALPFSNDWLAGGGFIHQPFTGNGASDFQTSWTPPNQPLQSPWLTGSGIERIDQDTVDLLKDLIPVQDFGSGGIAGPDLDADSQTLESHPSYHLQSPRSSDHTDSKIDPILLEISAAQQQTPASPNNDLSVEDIEEDVEEDVGDNSDTSDGAYQAFEDQTPAIQTTFILSPLHMKVMQGCTRPILEGPLPPSTDEDGRPIPLSFLRNWYNRPLTGIERAQREANEFLDVCVKGAEEDCDHIT